jgi:hypothetical protein
LFLSQIFPIGLKKIKAFIKLRPDYLKVKSLLVNKKKKKTKILNVEPVLLIMSMRTRLKPSEKQKKA